jgi:hypothetical protein
MLPFESGSDRIDPMELSGIAAIAAEVAERLPLTRSMIHTTLLVPSAT